MFELAVPEEIAREVMRLAAHKLPIKSKFVKEKKQVVRLMKAKEIRNLSTAEILCKVDDLKQELFNSGSN